MDFYVGTLTREGAEGLLICSLESDRLQKKSVFTQIIDPNYVIMSRDRKRLYSVSSDRNEAEMKGCVVEFAVCGDTLRKIASQPTEGAAPCFLTLDQEERALFVTNYGSGTVCVFPVRGGLRPISQRLQLSGIGPHPIRQTGPHPHQAFFIPGTRYLLVCDLGTDRLLIYEEDTAACTLRFHRALRLSGGPRHVCCCEDGKLWLTHELSNEVTAFRFTDGVLTPVQKVSTLPEGFAGENTAAAVRLSEDGKRLYVSNRGHGSIAVYDVDTNGKLSNVRWIPAGEFPRDFIVLEDGRFLIADQRNGILLESPRGEVLDLIPEKGAVCICPET